ncbi:hypothetical protein OIU76_011293 [Salix suchowensis]|nr:hypothetical protein OIU76_011293 [Salix suchowensis]
MLKRKRLIPEKTKEEIEGYESSDGGEERMDVDDYDHKLNTNELDHSPSLWNKSSLNVRTNERYKERQRGYKNLRKALCVGYANKLAERMVQHNGYRTIGFKPQLVQVHPSSTLKTDEDGMFPNYIVYHELIATSRPFMRNVCAVEMAWVSPILKKLEKLDIDKLSGGSGRSIREESEKKVTSLPKKEEAVAGVPDDRESRIQAARDRFLARKGKK